MKKQTTNIKELQVIEYNILDRGTMIKYLYEQFDEGCTPILTILQGSKYIGIETTLDNGKQVIELLKKVLQRMTEQEKK